MSILESSCYELRIADGLILMHSSLRGWEAFPTPRALTHTRITWVLSPKALQVPGVTRGSPCAHGGLGTSHREVRDTSPPRAHGTSNTPHGEVRDNIY